MLDTSAKTQNNMPGKYLHLTKLFTENYFNEDSSVTNCHNPSYPLIKHYS